jgi:hypothetical protein
MSPCRPGELKQAWVTISQYNYIIAERSYDLDPTQPVLGRLSRAFMMVLARAIAALFKKRQPALSSAIIKAKYLRRDDFNLHPRLA